MAVERFAKFAAEDFPSQQNVINILPDTFGTLGIRAGDLIAMINFLVFLREKRKNPHLMFYLRHGVLVDQPHVHAFFSFLISNTNYFAVLPGKEDAPWANLHLWDLRSMTGDLIHLDLGWTPMTPGKIVVFPLYDAKYNTQRNWSVDNFIGLLKILDDTDLGAEKIVCAKDDLSGIIAHSGTSFQLSQDFTKNLMHIRTAETYVGGDTGMTHFATALVGGPRKIYTYYSARSLIHTLPWHGRARLRTFWQNFDDSTYDGKLIDENQAKLGIWSPAP